MNLRDKNIKKLEDKLGIDSLKDFLYDLYINQMKTTREIALIIYGNKQNYGTINSYLKYFEIPIRHGSKAIQSQYVGEKGIKRKEQQRDIANTVLQTKESRDKLRKVMETDEYKHKQSISKQGKNNGMYGVKGEEHPRWDSNRTHEQRESERKTYEYSQWRKQVFEKDNYTCQHCGDNKGHNLIAHHKDSYDWCNDKRYDVNNGVTLCNKCHKEFHSIYGYGNNTEQQYKEWNKEV